MTDYVLDASALVALIRREAGWRAVEACLPTAFVSAVNFSETIYILRRRGMPIEAVREVLTPLVETPEPFDAAAGYAAAALVEATRSLGLSFGDCACLALAQLIGATAVTAEQRWDEVEADIKIKRIR